MNKLHLVENNLLKHNHRLISTEIHIHRDKVAQARIRVRLRQVQAGNLGDCEPVGEGVIELRIHIGAGYRVYCGRHGKAIVILLCGGDKGSQAADIRRAKELWSEWKRRQT